MAAESFVAGDDGGEGLNFSTSAASSGMFHT